MKTGIRISSLVPSGLVVETVSDSCELDYFGGQIGQRDGRMSRVRDDIAPNP